MNVLVFGIVKRVRNLQIGIVTSVCDGVPSLFWVTVRKTGASPCICRPLYREL